MVDVPSSPGPQAVPDEPGGAANSSRRWIVGVVLTTVVNLAATATTVGGLWLQKNSVDLERMEVVNAAVGKIHSSEDRDQAEGFGLLRDVMREEPEMQEVILASVERYLRSPRLLGAEEIKGLTGTITRYVAIQGTQDAAEVIRARDPLKDQGGPGQRSFFLPGMKVDGVAFKDVVMRGTVATGCYARWTIWNRADLGGSEFQECRFDGAQFVGAKLNGVDFTGAFLKDADFRDADLVGANLNRAVLGGVDLKGANLRGAKFGKINFENVSFDGVESIAGADFSQVKQIERAWNLRDAPGRESAIWPPGS
ncbi:pentapeptide repeat-containing protein [Saccharopolyspora sp. WRP15-2]|uniref:Pentapeptide repeat-containing protein n=1 Tax=Saccharopolyspora oryzae TaxID=2997343 RepID=A0ABT4V3G0_9PSEU|nr:pentapeptide repeat-containing protein [Saccharopolyspora oryzae]MDA3628497.1 pentapeptide repeat-containing protein [Saccharopolyspora oryzae]